MPEINRRIEPNQLALRSSIVDVAFAPQLTPHIIETFSHPISLLVRERGVPSSVELSLDEPKYLVFLEDVSNGGWEAALIKLTKESSRAVGFDIRPADPLRNITNPAFCVSGFERGEGAEWKMVNNGVSDRNFGAAGFELVDGIGYLAGVAQDELTDLLPDLQASMPFVIEMDQTANQAVIHYPNKAGEWQIISISSDQSLPDSLLSQVQVIASLDQEMLQRLLDTVSMPLQTEKAPFRSNVPDPLEGIIEGETRHERYLTFFHTVLSEIWLEAPDSGEYGDDFHRSRRFDRGDISGFTQFGPHNRDMTNLNAHEFEVAVDKLGPDYLRVRAVPPHVLDPDVTVIPTGGSCIIETAGMRTTAEMKKGIEQGKLTQQDLADFARRLSELAPTITHISGGVLGGQDALVHLVESDMWIDTLVNYGIPRGEAFNIVMSAYDRINDALARRSRLINPHSTMLIVNFDELGLPEAIREWEESVGVEYDPRKRIQEVIYTYAGAQQLQLLKAALASRIESGSYTQEEAIAANKFLHAAYQLRIKQTDHGRFKSMDLPKAFIMGKRDLTYEEKEKMATDPVYRMGTLLMRDVFLAQQNGTATALYAAFADLPGYGNQIQHESRDMGMKFTGRPGEATFLESVEAQLATPARLHRNNVEEHLEFLRTFLVDDKVAREALITEKTALLKEVSPVQRKEASARKTLAGLEAKIKELGLNRSNQQAVIKLLSFIRNPQTQELTTELIEVAKSLKSQKVKALEKIRAKEQDKLTEADREDLNQIPQLIAILDSIEKGEVPQAETSTIESELLDTEKTAERSVTDLQELIATKTAEKEIAESSLRQLQEQLQALSPMLDRINTIGEQIKQPGSQGLFPLSDNPFIHHSMQFLWDPDVVLFLRDATRLQRSQRAERTDVDIQLKALQADLDEKLRAAKSDPASVKAEPERLRTEFIQKTEPLNQQKTQIRDRYSAAMRKLMAAIHPKLETYLLYLYGRIDEESALTIRRTRVFIN